MPHEPVLRVCLQGRFGAQVEIDDMVQDAYARLLRARAQGTGVSSKACLFHVARNIALNQVRHRSYTHPTDCTENVVSSVVDPGEGVPETVARAEDSQLLLRAVPSLPGRCHQVFTRRKIFGVSPKEIAA
jgi:RNA polymerase sigma-70 factor (ECF subfamily)